MISFRRPDRDPRKLKHAGHVQIVGFERDRKCNDVEISDRSLRLEREELSSRFFVFAHLIRIAGPVDALLVFSWLLGAAQGPLGIVLIAGAMATAGRILVADGTGFINF